MMKTRPPAKLTPRHARPATREPQRKGMKPEHGGGDGSSPLSLDNRRPGERTRRSRPFHAHAPGEPLVAAAQRLSRAVERLTFQPPVSHVYNPLVYAWAPHERYLRRYGPGHKRVVFLGMNPGPFGMVQTGVPFGEVAAVRDWLGIEAQVQPPRRMHPRRPVAGFACARSEVSGRRLWTWFAARFKTPERFFERHLVINYCPLAFLESSGRNLTPDKLPAAERAALFEVCDEHLRAVVKSLRPEWVIGIGAFAFARAREVLGPESVRVGQLLHPSPASPAANRDWAGQASRQLATLGLW